MKRIVLFLLLEGLIQAAFSQVVSGTISDKIDNTKIDFASVYFNGTSAGTHSDQNGHFELDVSKYSSLPLTISALGYYTLTITDFTCDKPLEVYLVPKMFKLNEVIVSAKSNAKERRTALKLFKEQFLGMGYNGRNCLIMNEQDISFKNSGDTLKAFASGPINIVNNALGYKIAYTLDEFEYCWKCKFFLYKGSALFMADMSEQMSGNNYFEKRRRNTFLGSRSHFFSSLWSNSLHSNGFSIKNFTDETLNYQDIVNVRSGFKKYLCSTGNLYIYYRFKSQYSCIEPLAGQVFFESNGYFDGTGVNFSGQMSQERIGDLLPYDYKVK